ncbi:MBL fold metallo-hydrolase [Rhizobium laguerreae]|uniref:MBL fold metallo-hydrolase n=1 Tax=Rhizobium laguerreae TaxID=1076926 RepID=UPI001C9183C5|nr:MBL fold metallo-hydrolase [Rhizobium laguerreae]MBY3473625.1 MBL fold metallo-hydrolase [Rhizobium laguerreae]MBY3521633.1 MBL fold metallo-hydrolase [Rhizobium laguerreae]
MLDLLIPSLSVRPLAGYGEKSPACFLVEFEGRRFLLDLGEEPATGRLPELSEAGHIDAVLISHGHADHVGGLRALDSIGNPPVFASAMVRALGDAPLRSARDLPVRGRIKIGGVEIETGRSGHAPGAVWIRVGGPAGVLYSGDFSREGTLYAFDAPLPARYLIVDASYGTYDEPLEPTVDMLARMASSGPLLLPTQPNGRGLEMAVHFDERNIPIALCDNHIAIARRVLKSHQGVLDDNAAERLSAAVAAAVDYTRVESSYGAMLAADGSAASGLSETLLATFLERRLPVIFTSTPAEKSAAGQAIASGYAHFARWNVHPRLRDLRWLIEIVQPEKILLAFLAESGIDKLRDNLPILPRGT